MTNIQVAVNVSKLSVSGLIEKARLVTQRVTDHPTEFSGCVAANARVIVAITALEAAQADAVDGTRGKKALVRDRQQELIQLMGVLGHCIEDAASGDPAIVHMAGLDVKKKAISGVVEFKASAGQHPGSVNLRTKASAKTIYRWEYCQGVQAAGPWTVGAHSGSCKATISDLPKGIYWFRVVLIDASGEHEQVPLSYAVN